MMTENKVDIVSNSRFFLCEISSPFLRLGGGTIESDFKWSESLRVVADSGQPVGSRI